MSGSRITMFFNGYLLIDIRGNALERFINQINNNDIKLYNLKKIKKNHFQAKIKAKNFKKLRPLVKKRMCSVKIINKYGFPFLMSCLWKRNFMLFGFILLFMIIYLGSSFVWFYEIKGINQLSKEKVELLLNKSGIKIGTLKKNININTAEKNILKLESDIIWIDLSWKGTKLKVELVERKKVPGAVKGNLISNKNAIISEIIVFKGLPVVQTGDTVKRGQILIASSDESKAARGIAKGYVWYEASGESKLISKKYFFTGRNKRQYVIRIGGFKIYFPPIKINFKEYIKVNSVKIASEWRNIDFPLELINVNYKEIKFIKIEQMRKSAEYFALEEALGKILNKINNKAIILEILPEKLNVHDNNIVRCRLLLKTEEIIAYYKEELGAKD